MSKKFYGQDARGVLCVRASDYDALLAELGKRLIQIETLTEWYSNSLDVIREITTALPGAHYMDPPDGGDVSVPEQVHRMAKDAERYRWLRNPDQDVSLVLDKVTGEVPADEFGCGGYRIYEYRAGEELDAAIDAAMERNP